MAYQSICRIFFVFETGQQRASDFFLHFVFVRAIDMVLCSEFPTRVCAEAFFFVFETGQERTSDFFLFFLSPFVRTIDMLLCSESPTRVCAEAFFWSLGQVRRGAVIFSCNFLPCC
jgi:hypothetical protein